jgi:hypothetical protein
MATDWREAGYRADAKRVLNLYRRSFDNDAKRLARHRSVEALQAAGVQTVVCLWGGGYDAESLVAAGFRVIAVDNGSMRVTDGDREVSQERKRRALQYAAASGGYEWRWGDVRRFLGEADGALLDFHGPWAKDKRLIVSAARHMTAVVVVLVPSHDVSADASSAHERQMAYQLFLKMAWADRPRWQAITAGGHVRRLTDYHEDQGRHVFVYLMARQHIQVPALKSTERIKMRRDLADRKRASQRAWYHRPENRDRIIAKTSARKAALRKGPFLRECGCGTSFVSLMPTSRYCSTECRQAYKTEAQRIRRMAAVSGTAAEAISNEEAA